ncbi:glycosyltransferase family 4 protein [Alkalitalea saponilacus]|uniref:Glycosyltransferase involved in cell wall bisynthesis n=1 Tax=Alkalitalea saponilacus TaxID=889453 RepID=A0A1T5FJN5_9BACT|nr:glycosyltransferase family 4 protein [Alkalitalea saponilacus]ASB49419.1 hypothetical protein CDL62_09860 [Alkalitalea saponilacus]SKB96383.1 Glycosyltransferase involved in cell wall bisynthesis [Alkalitalea saponilacus]
MRIIQVYDKLDRIGGAQIIIKNLHAFFLERGYTSRVAGLNNYDSFAFKNSIPVGEYAQIGLKNIKIFSDTIIVSHSRKITSLLFVLRKVFWFKYQLIHVSHSIFNDKRNFTFFPDRVIGVSNAVKKNLINYFKVNEKRIEVIYNGLTDAINEIDLRSYQPDQEIRILFVGRIEQVKQQLLIVEKLAGKISEKIKIDFAGSGSQEDELINVIKEKGLLNFSYIGFQNNIPQLAENYHFVMLYSEKEGLGLTLIEACMAGRPVITRGADGCEACAEICIDNHNGYITNDMESLISVLNSLGNLSKEEYYKLCRNSRKIYENKFRIELMFEKYDRLINNFNY